MYLREPNVIIAKMQKCRKHGYVAVVFEFIFFPLEIITLFLLSRYDALGY